MGENTLGKLMKDAASMANIDKKITNHSVRKTTVTSLSNAGVPPQKIMKITGHRNIQSITHYDDALSEKDHRNICDILQVADSIPHAQNKPEIPSKSENQISQKKTPCFPSGCVFNSCTFNF